MDMKVICAWCGKHLKGNESSAVISHAICIHCLQLQLVTIEYSHIDPWSMWQDIGGEG
jgi:hypothetical protein